MKLKTSAADKWFSLKIRLRDDYTCQKCKIPYEHSENQLDCSHYHSRKKMSVRFDEDNCVTLCKKCHLYFDGNGAWNLPAHKKEHKEFMIKRLGQKRFDALEARASLHASHMRLNEIGLAIVFKQEVQEMKLKRMEGKLT